MRKRAFQPEAPACLEERSLLSGVGRPPGDPFVLSGYRYDNAIDQIRLNFQRFDKTRDSLQLVRTLRDLQVLIPFGQVDGLGAEINRIMKTMRRNLLFRVPDAIHTARTDVIAAVKAEVQARVDSGDVVVR